jgi:hypothetical protein
MYQAMAPIAGASINPVLLKTEQIASQNLGWDVIMTRRLSPVAVMQLPEAFN